MSIYIILNQIKYLVMSFGMKFSDITIWTNLHCFII